MKEFIFNVIRATCILAVVAIFFIALSLVGSLDRQEAMQREQYYSNYEQMVKNAGEGNHHLNRDLVK